MSTEYQVQKTGLQGREWKTVCRAPGDRARAMFQRQLRYHSIGRFRLLDPDGRVIEERAARPLFCRQEEPSWNRSPAAGRPPPRQEMRGRPEGL